MTKPKPIGSPASRLGRAKAAVHRAYMLWSAGRDGQFRQIRLAALIRCARSVQLLERKRPPASKHPRFASGYLEDAYRAALTACRMLDAEVCSNVRTQRVVAFRWAWAAVATEGGFSLPEVARSMCRVGHSTFCEALAKFWTDGGKTARHARALRGKILARRVACAGLPSGVPSPPSSPPGGSESGDASRGIVGAGKGSPITVMERMTV